MSLINWQSLNQTILIDMIGRTLWKAFNIWYYLKEVIKSVKELKMLVCSNITSLWGPLEEFHMFTVAVLNPYTRREIHTLSGCVLR